MYIVNLIIKTPRKISQRRQIVAITVVPATVFQNSLLGTCLRKPFCLIKKKWAKIKENANLACCIAIFAMQNYQAVSIRQKRVEGIAEICFHNVGMKPVGLIIPGLSFLFFFFPVLPGHWQLISNIYHIIVQIPSHSIIKIHMVGKLTGAWVYTVQLGWFFKIPPPEPVGLIF